MNKRVLLTVILALAIIFSVSAISASDVNVTDSYTANLVDDAQDVSVPMENTADSSEVSVNSDSNVDNDSSKVSLSSEEVLESDDSNTLSTNSDSNSDENNIIKVSSDADSSDKLATDDKHASGTDLSDTIQSKKVVTKYYKGSTKYSAKFTSSKGKALANTNVKIIVKGVTYTKTTDSNGVASLDINLKPGTYKITAVNPKTGYKLTTKFKILSTIKAKSISKIYTDGRKFYAKFVRSNGKPLVSKTVRFKLRGNTYSATTNSNGVASLSLVNLITGTHKIASYHPDGSKKVNKIKVIDYSASKLKMRHYTFIKTGSNTIRAYLDNGLGYAPGEGKTIKFTVNGQDYYRQTNSKGFAYLKLPYLKSGVYGVKARFAGNVFYKASSASTKIVILESKTPTLTVKGTTTFGYGANAHFKVAATSGNVALHKAVTFKVNGKSYTKYTNSKGIAYLPIDLSIGKHTIYYSVKKSSKMDANSGHAKITVKKRDSTSLKWKSGNSFVKGKQTFKVLLLSGKKALVGKTVKLTVGSKEYTAKVARNGFATFSTHLSAGHKKVSVKFKGNNVYSPTSVSKSISVKNSGRHNGYWVFGSDMKKVKLKSLSSKGVTDIFLNYYAVKLHGKSAVKAWVATAGKVGIDVHIWVQAFYGSDGWVNPMKNGAKNKVYFNKKIKEIKSYASIKGVDGIHLDYLRYPGTAYKTPGATSAINSFVRKVVSVVHGIDSRLIVSCALMPETTDMIKYYGQDYSVLSKHVDVAIPMVYKGNYMASSSWIKSTTKWYVSKSKGAKVWSGLQAYKSDDDVTVLSASALTKDIKSALNGGAKGVVLFRYGVSKSVNFNKITSSSISHSNAKKISINSALAGAAKLKKYYQKHDKFPKTITAGGVKFTMPEFLYVMTMAMYKLGYSNHAAIKFIKGIKAPPSPNGDNINSRELYKSKYVDMAKRTVKFIKKYKQAPNYASSAVGCIIYSELLDACSRVLSFYKEYRQLPNYVVIKHGSNGGSSYLSVTGSGLNEKNTIKNLKPFLKSTTHCKIKTPKIKAKVKSLTKGLKSKYDKARAIFNYVRDKISYSFYYDTNYGAIGTYNAKTGNCVDQAHLVICMFRTAGLPARYVHGTCTFSSGSTYGHVWAQVLIGNKWIVADPTSSRNSFGHVVNWNTNSYSLHAKYSSLPF